MSKSLVAPMHDIPQALWQSLRSCQQHSVMTGLTYAITDINGLCSRSSLICLPTGAGKSGVITVLAHFTQQKNVLVLCHRRSVCDQLYREIRGRFFEQKTDKVVAPVKEVFDDVDDDMTGGIYVTTFQKLSTLDEQQLATIKKNVDLIIIDEGHAEPSPVWKTLVRGSAAHKIVITATPYRNDLYQFDIHAGSSYVYTFAQAAEDRILVEPIFQSINEDTLINEISTFIAKYPGAKCIVKCKNFPGVEHYLALLQSKFKVLAVHDQYVRDARNNVKVNVPANIATSEYDVIIHQRKLDEGVDIPAAKLLILTYVVGSGRELVQTIGRVVRLFGDVPALVMEFERPSNESMWINYRAFDKSLQSVANVTKFLASLDSNKLIESYLDAFPEYSYYGNSFIRKFDLNEFDIYRSLVIPTASVCFLQVSDAFSEEIAADILYWRSNSLGDLAKIFDAGDGARIIVAIAFNRSRFLSDSFFFEPSLEITLVKRINNNLVGIYDSRGRRFTYDLELGIGAALPQDKLLRVMGLGKSVKTKETSSRSISSARKRPDMIVMKGQNLDEVGGSQDNGSRRVSTMRCDTFDSVGSKSGSYYVGVDSGRISDQKQGRFTLDELNEWFEIIAGAFDSKTPFDSNLLNSYARPADVDPELSIEGVVLDLSEYDVPLSLSFNGRVVELDNNFLYFEYKNGFLLHPDMPESIFSIDLEEEAPHLSVSCDHVITCSALDENGFEEINVCDLIFEKIHKVLLEKGVSYAGGKFYALRLPTENGFMLSASSLANVIHPMPLLLNTAMNEKGLVDGEIEVHGNAFSVRSVFYLLDQLKGYASQESRINDLGPFYQYIPAADLLICTDMGTEPADFIISSPEKLVYIHVKCGSVARPLSSAGAIFEVGSQALKNMEMLISPRADLRPGNWNTLLSKWPRTNAPHVLEERIRMFNKSIFASDGSVASQTIALEDVWTMIAERRIATAVVKEIWLVVANSFSLSHFERQLNRGEAAMSESLQAYQLIQGWASAANSNDVNLKIFVSP